MVTPGVEHKSYAPEFYRSASCTTASQSNNNSYVSNETGLPAEEHSRCLQLVTFGVKHISHEPELFLWASHAVASQSAITGNDVSNEKKLFA